MPVADHLSMLCERFLVSCMRRSQPSHELEKIPPGPRKNKAGRPLKETLSSRFGALVQPYLNCNGIIPEISYGKVKNDIHTAAVRASLAAAVPNPVLGVAPHPVHPSEQVLPCAVHTTLSQL
jgi:hypothetical protein